MGQKEEVTQQRIEEKNEKGKSAVLDYITGAGDTIRIKLSDPDFHKQALWTSMSIILALLVSAVIMAMAGYDAIRAFGYLFIGALREPDRVLQFATPLILTGLSVALAFKCGLFNIGAEGQLYMGSIFAAVAGFSISLPILVHPILCLAVGAIVGALYGLLPGLLKAYRGAHEVVTTMMLSYAAISVTSWLVSTNGPWRDTVSSELIQQTPRLMDTAILPNIIGPYLHWGILVALLAVVAVDFLINRTVLGYELRAVGLNEDAAEYAGINPKKNIALALALSGGLAGLAGAGEAMGTHNRFIAGWSQGLGFDGITVAVLGANNPWGVLIGAVFFGFLKAGGNQMQLNAGVPVEMVGVIQGLIVLFVAAPRIVEWLQKRAVEYNDWIKEEEDFPIAHSLGTMLSVVGLFISIGLITLMTGSIFAVLSLGLVSLFGLIGFAMFISRDERATRFLLLTLVMWLITAIADLLTSGLLIWIVSLAMGIMCVVDWYMLRKQSEDSKLLREASI